MGLDKNSIDTRPSTVKKNIFVSGCSTAGVYSVAHYHHRKIYIFSFLSMYCYMGLGKKSIETLPPPKKKLFLTTVLLRDLEKM